MANNTSLGGQYTPERSAYRVFQKFNLAEDHCYIIQLGHPVCRPFRHFLSLRLVLLAISFSLYFFQINIHTEFLIPSFIDIFRLKLRILRPAGGPVLQLPTA